MLRKKSKKSVGQPKLELIASILIYLGFFVIISFFAVMWKGSTSVFGIHFSATFLGITLFSLPHIILLYSAVIIIAVSYLYKTRNTIQLELRRLWQEIIRFFFLLVEIALVWFVSLLIFSNLMIENQLHLVILSIIMGFYIFVVVERFKNDLEGVKD
jgi:hypothetical protein